MNSPQQKIEDFLKGQRDCKEGVEHKAGMSDRYNAGYSYEYEMEQMKTERTGHAQNTAST